MIIHQTRSKALARMQFVPNNEHAITGYESKENKLCKPWGDEVHVTGTRHERSSCFEFDLPKNGPR